MKNSHIKLGFEDKLVKGIHFYDLDFPPSELWVHPFINYLVLGFFEATENEWRQ